IDLFGGGKSTDEVQLEKAIEVVECAGYRIVKTKEDSKELAVENGYAVSEPLIVNKQIVTLKDLRDYFFMRLWTKYPGKQADYYENWQQELRMIRLFVESIELRGLSKFNAIQRGIEIIDTIFNYEEEFRFKSPISIRVLGQGKAGWITGKAIEILNKQLEKRVESEMRQRADRLEDELAQELELQTYMDKNLDKIIASLE
ncbi:hypothetical protein LCGC14_1387410, partial [marine sediment metagenome]